MRAKILVILAVSGLLVVTVPAQELPTISPSIAQVVKLHESGVAADVLLAYAKETTIAKPNADEVLYLTEKGVPKDVIVTLISKRVVADAPAPPAQPQPAQQTLPPAVAPAQPAPQTVVVQQPAPTVTYVQPAPVYYPQRYYYNPWPSVAVGIGLGHLWYHGYGHYGHHHHGGHGHHGGGIHVHRR